MKKGNRWSSPERKGEGGGKLGAAAAAGAKKKRVIASGRRGKSFGIVPPLPLFRHPFSRYFGERKERERENAVSPPSWGSIQRERERVANASSCPPSPPSLHQHKFPFFFSHRQSRVALQFSKVWYSRTAFTMLVCSWTPGPALGFLSWKVPSTFSPWRCWRSSLDFSLQSPVAEVHK